MNYSCKMSTDFFGMNTILDADRKKMIRLVCKIIMILSIIMLMVSLVLTIGVDVAFDQMLAQSGLTVSSEYMPFVRSVKSVAKESLRDMILYGQLPLIGSVSDMLELGGSFAQAENRFVKEMLGYAFDETGPFVRLLAYLWAHAGSIRNMGLIALAGSLLLHFLFRKKPGYKMLACEYQNPIEFEQHVRKTKQTSSHDQDDFYYDDELVFETPVVVSSYQEPIVRRALPSTVYADGGYQKNCFENGAAPAITTKRSRVAERSGYQMWREKRC